MSEGFRGLWVETQVTGERIYTDEELANLEFFTEGRSVPLTPETKELFIRATELDVNVDGFTEGELRFRWQGNNLQMADLEPSHGSMCDGTFAHELQRRFRKTMQEEDIGYGNLDRFEFTLRIVADTPFYHDAYDLRSLAAGEGLQPLWKIRDGKRVYTPEAEELLRQEVERQAEAGESYVDSDTVSPPFSA